MALILAVVATMALGAAAQPATDGDQDPRDPWRDRIRPVADWCARSARDAWAWLLAGLGRLRGRWQARRARQASARSERRAQREADEAAAATAPPVAPNVPAGNQPTAAPVGVEPPAPEGVVATALRVRPDIAITETAGDEIPAKGPGLLVRIRSALGLILLISLLGLGLAVALGAAAAAISAAVDSFVS